MHCVNGAFPGIDRDGGFAQFLQTSARSVVKLDPSLEPKDIAALADAGLTAIHAVKKAVPLLGAGTKTVVIGAGGLGHIGIQCLKAMTPTEIIVVDPSGPALELARELGASELELIGDSELVARQIGGQYKVKHEGLRPLFVEAMRALREFDSWSVRSVRREQNERADELVNEELDAAAAGA
jgi:NAD+-dependent secondary alcohol dehydrogenase Adh1